MSVKIRLTSSRGNELYTIIDQDVSNKLNGKSIRYNKKGYCFIRWSNGKRKYKEVYLHRYIMNPPDDMTIDHINHDPLDNRRENLRICTQAENNKNKRSQGRPKGSKNKKVIKT